VELALRTGYGSPMDPGSPANPYGLGVGGRAGFAGYHVYAGLYADRWFGGSGTAGPYDGPGSSGAQITNHDSAWTFGGELGLNAAVGGIVTIRPMIGLGRVTTSVTASETPPDKISFSTLYFEPSLTFLVSWRSFFVGLDAGIEVLFSQPHLDCPAFGCDVQAPLLDAGVIHVQVGARLWP
jgi:hypothetical protein